MQTLYRNKRTDARESCIMILRW